MLGYTAIIIRNKKTGKQARRNFITKIEFTANTITLYKSKLYGDTIITLRSDLYEISQVLQL